MMRQGLMMERSKGPATARAGWAELWQLPRPLCHLGPPLLWQPIAWDHEGSQASPRWGTPPRPWTGAVHACPLPHNQGFSCPILLWPPFPA